jgi:putative glutamine amidotransferase
MQLLTIYAGGRLRPVDERVHAGKHDSERRPAEHAVNLSRTSGLARAVGVERLLRCASQHSYGVVLDGATSVVAVGWADDGTVEAIEFDSVPAFGVLWHPEDTYLVEPQQLDVLRSLSSGR